MPTAPFELVYGPASIYTGPVDEARPDLEDAPAGNWVLLGSNGSNNYAEDGVVVTPEGSIERFRVLGSTAPQKAARTEDDLMVTVTLHDLTAEHFAKVMEDVTVTDTAPGSGTAGVRSFNMLRTATIKEYALLVRIDSSPYIDVAASQFWLPRCYVESVGALTYAKDTPVGFEIQFQALESSTNGFGKYEAEDAQAT